MKQLFFFTLLFFFAACAPKNKYGSIGNYQVILENSKADIHVLMLTGKEKLESGKVYASYKNNRIAHTQGISGGKLLHGSYKEYFFEGAIKNSGSFDYGLKSGDWTFYDEEGFLLSSLKYKKGDTISPVLFFNKQGVATDTLLSVKALKKLEKKKTKACKKDCRFSLFKKEAKVVSPKDSI